MTPDTPEIPDTTGNDADPTTPPTWDDARTECTIVPGFCEVASCLFNTQTEPITETRECPRELADHLPAPSGR